MNYKIEFELPESRLPQLLEVLKSMTFVKGLKTTAENEIRNPRILQAIEAYEASKEEPVKITLSELKSLLRA